MNNLQPNGRIASLDALRGFDMLFIAGLAYLIRAICCLFPGGESCWLEEQMHHVAWDGLTHHDTIFPLFIFIAGVSFPFSYAKQVSVGRNIAALCRGQHRRVYRPDLVRGPYIQGRRL